MNERIILICNGCPFVGETFLQKELQRLPDDRNVTLMPILANKNAESADLKENVEVVNGAGLVCRRDLLAAGFLSLWSLVQKGELSAVFRHKLPLRNLLKAVKFAFLAESRARAICRWLAANHGEERFVFYAYWLYEAAYTAARLQQMHPGSRFVSRCHGYDLYEIRHPGGYLPYRNYLMSSVRELYPISQDGKDYLSRLYGGKWDEKIHVMRLGTEDHGENPTRQEQPMTVVSCSNLVEVKRVDRLISALCKATVPIRWIHFGDGPLRGRLEQQAASLPENVQWQFMGSVPNEKLMEFYGREHVDVFVNVSSSEGVPVSVMEALSFGIPAIATDVGGTHEIVESGVNGIILKPDFSDEELLDAFEAIRMPEIAMNMRVNARKIWQERCDAGKNFPRFYTQLIP